MKIRLLFAFGILLNLAGTTSSLAADNCKALSDFHTPQPLFSKPEGDNFLQIKKVKSLPAHFIGEKVNPENGNYYVFVSEQQDVIFVYSGKKYHLELKVPEYRHRPLEVKWINPKLIHLQVSFNPRYGAYWIYDVEKEKIVMHELENDGQEMWQQCKGSNEQ